MKTNEVVSGLVVVAVGLAFLGSNLGYFDIREIWQLWPVILIVIGASNVLFPGECSRTSGLPLLLVGGVFLAHNYDVLHIRDSWPLFVVSAGLGILASSWETKRKGPDGKVS